MIFINVEDDSDKLITMLNIKKEYTDVEFLVTLNHSDNQIENYINYDINKNILNLIIVLISILIVLVIIYFTRR